MAASGPAELLAESRDTRESDDRIIPLPLVALVLLLPVVASPTGMDIIYFYNRNDQIHTEISLLKNPLDAVYSEKVR